MRTSSKLPVLRSQNLVVLVVVALGLVMATGGCNKGEDAQTAQSNVAAPVAVADDSAQTIADESQTKAAMVKFTNVTKRSGITVGHFNGAFGAALLPETMGSGCAVFDYNGDGLQDIFLVNGRAWTPGEIAQFQASPVNSDELQVRKNQVEHGEKPATRLGLPPGPPPKALNTLYRNNGDGTFSDVSEGSGLQVVTQGMGAAAADYDGDGRTDLCVTAYGQLLLFHNETGKDGKPKFRDVSGQSGVTDKAWSTSATFFDYDRDGKLDLFVCRYVKYSPGTDVFRSLNKRQKTYGWPKDYPSQTSLLFRNQGAGQFKNVSASAGISKGLRDGKPIEGAGLGVIVCDPNQDGWPDLVVANDMRSNFYFVNQKDGTFIDQAAKNGIATGPNNQVRGGMGIDDADIDHSGNSSVAIGHFNAEGLGFWQSSGGAFTEVAAPLGLKKSSITSLTFGLIFADLNNDTWPDLLAANGHVDPMVNDYLMLVLYRQRPLFYLNETRASGQKPVFREVGEQAGLTRELVARGLATLDFDGDGDLDLLFTTNDERPRLYRNEGTANHSVRVTLRAKAPNRDAIGAHIDALVGQETVRRDVRSGSSYLSQSELPVTIGAGAATRVDKLKITWPDGSKAEYLDLPTGQNITIVQGKGIVARQPFRGAKRGSE